MPRPDRVFMKRLKALSPKLGCNFSPNIERFVITHERAVGPPVPICKVAREDGGFRQPDNRDIAFVQSGDLAVQSVDERLKKVAKHMETVREQDKKRTASEIRDMTKDGKIQLSRAIGKIQGSGKYDPFRKVTPKSKGKAF